MPSEKLILRLKDILKNIERIQQYTSGYGFEGFAVDQRCQDAVERCLSRISEAVRKLEGREKEIAPDLPWADIRKLGNVLRHEYDSVEAVRIWHIVIEDLTPLRDAIQRTLARMSDRAQDS